MSPAREPTLKLSNDVSQLTTDDPGFGECHGIDRLIWIDAQAERFPEQPLDAVSRDRAPDPPAHRDSEPRSLLAAPAHREDEPPAVAPHSAAQDALEVRAAPDPLVAAESHRALGGDAPPTLLATSLEHELASLGSRPHKEAVSPLPLSVVGLKRSLHPAGSPIVSCWAGTTRSPSTRT